MNEHPLDEHPVNEHQEQDQEHIGRRRLLRGAGAVVAGVAGAGVAGAVAATPAQADTGQPTILGAANTANLPTGITLTGATLPREKPVVRLTNADGPALTVDPVNFESITAAAPVGSIFSDVNGDLWLSNEVNTVRFNSLVYSPTWASMTVPINPVRILDTRDPGNRDRLIGVTPDSSGRIITGRAFVSVDDMINFAYGVQLTITIDRAVRNGFAAVWGAPDWPGHSSVNFTPTFPISNFCQTEIAFLQGPDVLVFSLLVNSLAAVIVDVVGFVVSDVFVDLKATAAQAAGITKAADRAGRKTVPRISG